ncbi:MAG TPA: VWA domain-containing protein [Thermoanaerobaculia bacterium]|nr:VWA domain-containing protein [Thermoanaerobaculia bacterium]
MSFGESRLLLLLGVIPFLAWFLVHRERVRRANAARFVSERLRGVSNTARISRPWFVCVAFAVAILAVAGPRAGTRTIEVPRNERDRVVVVDVSKSMSAEDVGTSRLDAAKAVARKVMSNHSGRVALIIFERSAEVISPLTTDAEAVSTLLDTIEAGELSQPGSDLGGAIDAAIDLAGSSAQQKLDVVLISDGEDQGKSLRAAISRATKMLIPVHTVTIGTADGAPIRSEGETLKDDSGKVVTTVARSDVMKEIARGTSGRALVNPFGESSTDVLTEGSVSAGGRMTVEQPVERFQWPLAISLLLFFCGSLTNRGAE